MTDPPGERLVPAVAAVRRAVRLALADLDPGSRVLVACSGGADSMALADAALFEARRTGWLVGAVIVDHGLQPGSDQVAREAADRLGALGCEPVEVVSVEVGSDGGPEAAARAARYEALGRVAEAHDATVLLGHTLDDQAESVLLGLARGSGTRSMSGMPEVTGRFRRPLLGVRREQTRQACDVRGLTRWEDPHNDDPAFARVRVRRSALPALEAALGPGVTEALARTAAAAREDADTLDELAAQLHDTARGDNAELDVEVLARARPALRRRALRRAALEAGCPAGDLFVVHVDELERLVLDWHGQGPLTLPGGVRATRSQGGIFFSPPAVGR
jgi:tRNA(Ile)-lysidine synthase